MEDSLNKLLVYGNADLSLVFAGQDRTLSTAEYPFLKKINIRPLTPTENPVTKKNIFPKLDIGVSKSTAQFNTSKVTSKDTNRLLIRPSVRKQRNVNLNINNIQTTNASLPVVHIYGKAAISRFLWSHVMEGNLEADLTYPGTLFGQKALQNIHLVYREGGCSDEKELSNFKALFYFM